MGRWRPPSEKGPPYITEAGADALTQELKQLWEIERPKVTNDVHEAAKNGDRSENGDFIIFICEVLFWDLPIDEDRSLLATQLVLHPHRQCLIVPMSMHLMAALSSLIEAAMSIMRRGNAL